MLLVGKRKSPLNLEDDNMKMFTLLQEWWLVLEDFQRPNNINSTMMKFSGSTMEFVLFSLKYIFKLAFMFTEVKTCKKQKLNANNAVPYQ